MNMLAHVEALCARKDPYKVDRDTDSQFAAAVQEIVAFHCANTPDYQRWLTHHGLSAANIVQVAWSQLPPLFADYFKQRLITSNTDENAIELTSSGTSGQKSRMRYDQRSLGAAQAMVDAIFRYYDWETPNTPCNYLLLSYEPAASITLGTSYTDQFLCKYAPINQVVYALRNTGTGHEFDPFGVIQALQRFAKQDMPVRIFGFPAFMWFVLERMRAMRLPALQLHPDSLVFFGGGWKNHADRELTKAQLYQQIGSQLGIADQRCRDGYGAVEHCVPYIECIHHHFHLPVYAKALIRDTASWQILRYGQPGFLQFVAPYITSSPAHSIVMSDRATLHPSSECGCGLQTDWFALLGRASRHKAFNCALAAAEFIKQR